MDRGLFYKIFFQNFGDSFLGEILTHVETYVSSDKESEQRVAAEVIFGAIQ